MTTEKNNNGSIYHRKNPVVDLDINQTMYNSVFLLNNDNLDQDAIGFLGKNVSYYDLKKNVDMLAAAYQKAGVKEGDVVGIATINMPIVQENLLALSKLGATSKWIDLRCKENDLINDINESNCKILVIFDGMLGLVTKIISETDLKQVLVASPKDYLNPFIRIFANLKEKKEGKNMAIPDDARFVKYYNFIKTGNNSLVIPATFEKERPSIILKSSGSTGKSKSIIHTEYNFNLAMQKEAYTDLPFAKGKTMHISIPPFIIYGLNNSIYASMIFGMKAEMSPYISENTVFDDLGKYEFACAAPLHYRYMYNKIIELNNAISELEKIQTESAKKELKKCLKELSSIMKRLSKVQVFVSGGDNISVQELLDMEQTFGKPIINGYGNNELAGAAIISPVYACKPKSVGIPMKNIVVRSFTETNEMLPQGVEGEICVNTDNAFIGYLNNEKETARIKQMHDDGKEWIHTGDLGYVDEDGFVYITGRIKRLIKRAAFKICPDTIENIIMLIPEVQDCVVVGVPDDEELFVPLAFVKSSIGNSEIIELVKQICKKELPDYEIPKYIIPVDVIPYKNNKHNFIELEKQGKAIVKKMKK